MALGCQQGARTALTLGSHPLSDSGTSGGRATKAGSGSATACELERRLRTNIPWQPVFVPAEIVEAAHGRRPVWLYVKGTDHAAARRMATVIAEARCGSPDCVIWADPSRFSCADELCADFVSRASEIGGQAFVLVVDDVENAPCDVVDCLVVASERGRLKDHSCGRELDLSIGAVASMVSVLIYHKCLKDYPFGASSFTRNSSTTSRAFWNSPSCSAATWRSPCPTPASFVTLEECVSRVVARVRLMLAAKAGGAAVLRVLHVTRDDFARLWLTVLSGTRSGSSRSGTSPSFPREERERREKREERGKRGKKRMACGSVYNG
jgi:hypothetical protein